MTKELPRRELLRQGLMGLGVWMLGCSSDSTSPAGNAGAGGTAGGAGAAGTAGAAGGGGTAGASGGGGIVGSGGFGAGSLVSKFADIGELQPADANGLRIPPGFSIRVVARSGEPPIAGAPNWHQFPDGGATFALEDGGWIYVSNSEVPLSGGVGALRFDAQGAIVGYVRILENTSVNCAGGTTPWGTWLSCEEIGKGKVFECDPTGATPAVVRLALGVFKHEAAVVDPVGGQLYLSEDESDGRFYRFTPATPASGGRLDLGAGKLEVATVAADKKVTWTEVPDPEFTGATATRRQVPESTAFRGGEGLWIYERKVYLGTKGDNRVWVFDILAQTMDVHYDAATASNPILSGVDNLTGSAAGEVLVAEDGGDMQLVAILADGTLKPVVQVEGQNTSEITGPAFDPSGTRLYFSSQRGGRGGITYEMTGPFHAAS